MSGTRSSHGDVATISLNLAVFPLPYLARDPVAARPGVLWGFGTGYLSIAASRSAPSAVSAGRSTE